MRLLALVVGFIVLIFALRLGELYTQVARYRTYWHRHNELVLACDSEKPRYFALGDSTAQGIGATSPDKSYPSVVAETFKKNGKPVDLINLSKSGAKIQDVTAEQIPQMKKLGVSKDAVVTIEIGANDIFAFDKNRFEKDMDKMMGQLPKQTVISDIPSFQGGRFASFEKNVLEANEIVVRLADKYNLRRALLYDRVSNNHGLRMFAADLFHPSTKSYRENWAPAFIEQLR